MKAEPSLWVTPRRPGIVRHHGELACRLSGAYGLTPYDWQSDCVVEICARRKNGAPAASTVKITVPRQNGKNGILEIVELYFMSVLGLRILHTAHEVKTARKAFARLKYFFGEKPADPGAKFPELNALVREVRSTNGQEAIFLTNGGSIEFIARSKSSGRGFTVDVLVCDEDQELTDDELAALLPTMSAAPSGHSQLILTGTPPDPERWQSAAGEVARRTRKDALEKADPDLFCVDYGVPDGPMPDVDDVSEWYRRNPGLVEGLLSLAAVKRERRRMSPEMFARERLGWWGDPAAMTHVAIFGIGRWEALAVQDEPPEVVAIGIAVSRDLERAALGAAGHREDGRIQLGLIDRRDGTDWTVAEAKRIQDEHGCAVLISEKCPDKSLIRKLKEAGVDVTVLTLEDEFDATATLLAEVKDLSVAHMDDPDLNAAVQAAAWREVGDRKLLGRKQSTGDVAPLEAVFWAHRGAVLDLEYDVEDSFLTDDEDDDELADELVDVDY